MNGSLTLPPSPLLPGLIVSARAEIKLSNGTFVSPFSFPTSCPFLSSLYPSLPLSLPDSLLLSFPDSLTLSLCLSLEEMCVELSRAIEAGDPQAASVCAASLARKQMALRIQPSEKNYEDAEIK